MIADKAKTDATNPEIRKIAHTVSSQETERASVYAALLTSWNESYLNITDLVKLEGAKIGYGELVELQIASQAEYKAEMRTFRTIRNLCYKWLYTNYA